MDWMQFMLLVLAMGGMFQWLKSSIDLNRSEASADRRDMLNIIRNNHDEIKLEMKDFHGRLCTLEERYLQIITKKD